MKESIILYILLLLSLSGWAKANNAFTNNSVCIIEGTIKNIPDGCDVILYGFDGKYSGKQKTITQIKNGKFHFKKKVKGDEKYSLFLYPCIESITLYVSPKTKSTITGTGTSISTWTINSNNLEQQEYNAYHKVEVGNFPEYASAQNRRNEINVELLQIKAESEKQSLIEERKLQEQKINSLHKGLVEVMYDFMKERPYSKIFAINLRNMIDRAKNAEKKDKLWDEPLTEKVRKLLEKVPQENLRDKDITYVRKKLNIQTETVSQIKKSVTPPFTKIITTNALENGWCTFFDSENNYEVDGHTDIYTIRVVGSEGILELVDVTNRIIPAGCPVILHLNNVLDDGTHRAVLTEAKEANTKSKLTRWNVLDVSTSGERIKAWRLGISDDKVALYPWKTDNAEPNIVYLRMPNRYIDMPKDSASTTNYKLEIDVKNPIGHTQNHFRYLLKKPVKANSNISYIPNATLDDNDMKVISISGKNIKIADGNEYVFPRFLMGNTMIVSKLWSDDLGYHASNFGQEGWGKPHPAFSANFYAKTNEQFKWLLFAKNSDNSLLLLDASPSKFGSLTIIPNTNSIENISDSTKWEKYDLAGLGEIHSQAGNFYPMSDSTILLTAPSYTTPGHIIHVINYKNKTYTPLDYWPNDGIEIDSILKSDVYSMYSMTFGNNKGHYLFVCHRERNAFIFSIENNKINVIKDLYSTYLNYTTKDNLNYIAYKIRPEGLYCTTTNDDIFILLTDRDKFGKKIKQGKWNNQRLYGNIIEIYDWDGKQRKKLIKLDHIGQRIMLSDDNKTLYLFTDDYFEGEPNPQIWAYDISNLNSETNGEFLVDINECADYSSENTIASRQKTMTKVVEESDMMADFELYDYNDKPHHLNEFVGTGKYTILEFSGLGCGPCHAAKPFLEKFYKDNKDRFEMITISNDNEKLWKKKPLGEVSWHEWNDYKSAREISLKYGVNAIPTFIIISPEGKIEKKCLGIAAFIEALKKYIPMEELEKLSK